MCSAELMVELSGKVGLEVTEGRTGMQLFSSVLDPALIPAACPTELKLGRKGEIGCKSHFQCLIIR